MNRGEYVRVGASLFVGQPRTPEEKEGKMKNSRIFAEACVVINRFLDLLQQYVFVKPNVTQENEEPYSEDFARK
jgi:hypothetical protein